MWSEGPESSSTSKLTCTERTQIVPKYSTSLTFQIIFFREIREIRAIFYKYTCILLFVKLNKNAKEMIAIPSH